MEATSSRLVSVAAQLFAEKGYSGASMRNIANAVGTTQAAIYHHFPNKESLYMAVLARHFEAKTSGLAEQLDALKDPEQQLALMVNQLLRMVYEDELFRQLYLRELLEGDGKRLQALAENVFGDIAETVTQLLNKLAPAQDAHLMLLSVAGLIVHHLEARKLSPFLPGSKKEHQQLDTLSDHITNLLLHGMQGS